MRYRRSNNKTFQKKKVNIHTIFWLHARMHVQDKVAIGAFTGQGCARMHVQDKVAIGAFTGQGCARLQVQDKVALVACTRKGCARMHGPRQGYGFDTRELLIW